ncbi:unnamed protein product [Euphydryas editha]|uniref:Histone H1 n=1 Tax=Euphydryas editha TaxID=104508 RepID=A0AAU9TGM8_EUPED|nr:unnamed protein product [Euphydryas editha]
MLDARFAGLEDRLLPAKTLRPPLAADRRKVSAQESHETAPTPSTSRATTKPARRKGTPANKASAPASANNDGEWTTVVKRKKKKAPKSYAAAAAAAAPAPKEPRPQPPTRPKRKTKKAKKPKMAAPRSPAVLITLEEYAESKGITYCHLLERAAETVDLEAIGIVGGMNIRRSAVPGTSLRAAERADPRGGQTSCGGIADGVWQLGEGRPTHEARESASLWAGRLRHQRSGGHCNSQIGKVRRRRCQSRRNRGRTWRVGRHSRAMPDPSRKGPGRGRATLGRLEFGQGPSIGAAPNAVL